MTAMHRQIPWQTPFSRRLVGLATSVALTVGLLAGSAPLAHAANHESESNDTMATADEMGVNAAIAGNISSSSDVDYYKFTTMAAGCVQLVFTHANLTYNEEAWSVNLYDEKSNFIDFVDSDQNEPWVSTSKVGLPAGTYYVRVFDSWETDNAEYQLTANFTATNSWETEFNETFLTSDAMALNTAISGTIRSGDDNTRFFSVYDSDYYNVTTAMPGWMQIRFTHENLTVNQTAWGIFLYDDKSNVIDTLYSAKNQPAASMSKIGLPAGTYYIVVFNSTGDSDAEYQLTANFTATDSWETEFNDTFATSDPIALRSPISGTIASMDYYHKDEDYYNFTTLNPGYISATLAHAQLTDSNKGWTVTIYDANSKELTSFYSAYNKPSVSSSWIWVEPGLYYVKVEGEDYWNEPSDDEYTLSVESALTTATPTISGSTRVGKTLKADPGAWGPAGVALAFQWTRGGADIYGANGTTYTTTKADIGKAIAFRVTGSLAGYRTESLTSASVTISKYSSATKLTLSKSKIKKGKKLKVTVKVTTALTKKPTGKIVVEYGSKSKTYTLKAAKKGKLTVTLPKFKSRGTVKIKATYKGAWNVSSSKSAAKKLSVR
jgi:hypothetical protein